MATETKDCECGVTVKYNEHCGAYVCDVCENHIGLVRCFCGWSLSGANGRQELEEMGENIDPDDY